MSTAFTNLVDPSESSSGNTQTASINDDGQVVGAY